MEGVTPGTVASRLSTIRHEIVLPDDALVVRGGTLKLEDLEKTALVSEVKLTRPGISVYAADVDDPAALLRTVSGTLFHNMVSFTRVGRLRVKGFELEQTFDPPHHTVWLPEREDREYWLREFRMSFDVPISREQAASYVVGT